MPIDCSKCKGYCCMVIGDINPNLDRGDKVCINFDEDTHKCRIYDHRPLICNTDLLYNALYKDIIPRNEYDRLNHDACTRLSNYFKNEVKENLNDFT